MTAPWLRLDAAVFSDPKVCAAGPFAGAVWVALLTIAKAGGTDGRLPAEALEGAYLASYLHFPIDTAEALGTSANGLERSGLLRRDGDEFVIRGWDKYQGDPTARERRERFEAKRRRRVTDKERSGTPENVRNGDVTGRDVTEEPSPTPPLGTVDGASGDRFPGPIHLSPGVHHRVRLDGIDLRSRPGFGPEWEKTVQAAADVGRLDDALLWLKDPANTLREPRDLRRHLEPAAPFGRPPAPSPDRLKAERDKREEEALAERVRDLSRLKPEDRVAWLSRLEAAKGAKYRAEVERRLGGAA